MNLCPAAFLQNQFLANAHRIGSDAHAFDNATILLTGGTGFFGKWLLGTLLAVDQVYRCRMRIMIPTRNPGKFQAEVPSLAGHPAVTLLPMDLTRDPLPDQKFSHIIHAATDARERLNRENPLRMIETILDGTRNVLNCAQLHQPSRMIFVSSGAVYGTQPDSVTAMTELWTGGPDPLGSGNAYHEAKRMAEQMCAAAVRTRGLPHIAIARCFAFVGPWLPLDSHFAIGNFIADALAERPITLRGDGSTIRSYLDAGDLAVWLLTILIRGESLHPYNVGSDEGFSLAEIAQLVAKTYDSSLGIQILGKPSKRPVDRYVPSIARAEAELGLRKWTPLAAAIRNTILWHRRDVHSGSLTNISPR